MRIEGLAFRRGGAVLAAAVLAMGLVAGCGDDGGEEEADVPVLDEQVGFDGEAALERRARAENLIRDCMQAKGFEYIPVDPAAQEAELTGSRELSEEEFIAQYGDGITTLFEARLQQAVTGPNQPYYNALDDGQKAAYDQALYGQDKTETIAVALDDGDFSRLGGCVKEAAEQVFGGADFVQDLTTKLDDLDERILADPRIAEVIDKWTECMNDAGYDFRDPEEVDAYLENKLEAIVGSLEEAKAPAPGTEPPWDQATLEALKREEVELKKLDVDCEEEHIAPVEEKVRAEYEREFRENNAALLDKVPPT